VRENRALRCYDTELDPRVDRMASRRLGIRSLAVAPLREGGRVVGIVEVFSLEVGRFDEASLRIMERMAIEASAPAIEAHAAPGPGRTSSQKDVASGPGLKLLDRKAAEIPEREISIASLPSAAHQSEPLQFLAAAGQLSASRWNAPWKLIGACGVLLLAILGATEIVRSHRIATLLPGFHQSSLRGESDFPPEVTAIAERAKSGDASAQRSFADFYAGRKNSEKDLVKAATWYVIAGIRGDQRAGESASELTRNFQPFEIAQVQFNVGKMFAAGLGVPRDQVSAYAWFLLAQAAGDVRAESEIARLSPTMTAQQTAAARQRAAAWLGQSR
jgi:hypothetical protein